MTRPFVAVALGLALGCASPTDPADGPFRVTAKDAVVRLENVSDRPVFYLVYEREAAALINWSACVAQDCPSVAPGATAAIPYPAIGGYTPGRREAIVWWWEAVPGVADASVPGAVHAVVVGL